jgi:predicted HAD superfamily Cof-like phosphohydrolase
MKRLNAEERIGLLENRRQQYRTQVQSAEDDIEILKATSADEDDYVEAVDKLKRQIDQLKRADKVAEGMVLVLKNSNGGGYKKKAK